MPQFAPLPRKKRSNHQHSLDGEGVRQFYGRLDFKDLTVTSMYGSRRRSVPTASFGTVFNEQVSPEEATDRHTLMEGQYLSSRETLVGSKVSAAATLDFNIFQPLGSSWELFGGVRNVFNAQYSDPVSTQHRQEAILQNGRTARLGLRWKVRAE